MDRLLTPSFLGEEELGIKVSLFRSEVLISLICSSNDDCVEIEWLQFAYSPDGGSSLVTLSSYFSHLTL